MATVTCYRCRGRGLVKVSKGRGPAARLSQTDCPGCEGVGEVTLAEGARVVLMANEAEGWPEEVGEVLGLADDTLVVQVPASEPGDDGLREVTYDQILGYWG